MACLVVHGPAAVRHNTCQEDSIFAFESCAGCDGLAAAAAAVAAAVFDGLCISSWKSCSCCNLINVCCCSVSLLWHNLLLQILPASSSTALAASSSSSAAGILPS
jgi:hypothetical protein